MIFKALSPIPSSSEDTLARQSDVTVSNTTRTLYAEYKGFFVFVLATVTITAWLVWSFAPDWALHGLGITYYPDRYWSMALPAYFLMGMLFTYIIHVLWNTEIETIPLDDKCNFIDEHAVMAGEPGEGPSAEIGAKWVHNYGSGVRDLPISVVNDVLYGRD